MAPASEEAEHFRADAGWLRGIARSCASFRVMAGAPAGPGCASGVCGGCAIEPECGSGGVSRKRRVGERMIGKRTPGIMRRAAAPPRRLPHGYPVARSGSAFWDSSHVLAQGAF